MDGQSAAVKDRQKIVERFQRKKSIPVFLLSAQVSSAAVYCMAPQPMFFILCWFLFLSKLCPYRLRLTSGISEILSRTAFVRGELIAAACGLQVGGLGLTITAADRVIILDPSWNPAGVQLPSIIFQDTQSWHACFSCHVAVHSWYPIQQESQILSTVHLSIRTACFTATAHYLTGLSDCSGLSECG